MFIRQHYSIDNVLNLIKIQIKKLEANVMKENNRKYAYYYSMRKGDNEIFIKNQEAYIERLSEKGDINISKIYYDVGKIDSNINKGRGFIQLLDDIENNNINGIVFWDLFDVIKSDERIGYNLLGLNNPDITIKTGEKAVDKIYLTFIVSMMEDMKRHKERNKIFKSKIVDFNNY